MFHPEAVGWYVEYYYPGFRDDEIEQSRTVYFVNSDDEVVDYEDLCIYNDVEDLNRWREIDESDLEFLGGFDIDLNNQE